MEHVSESLIDHAIAHTRAYLQTPGGDRRIAQAGLERILVDLAARAPGHPALLRLAAFIADLRRVGAGSASAEGPSPRKTKCDKAI